MLGVHSGQRQHVLGVGVDLFWLTCRPIATRHGSWPSGGSTRCYTRRVTANQNNKDITMNDVALNPEKLEALTGKVMGDVAGAMGLLLA